MNTKPIKFVYFGSSRLSVIVLDELEKRGYFPMAVVTTPDKPQGRKFTMTPNVTKTWAKERKIEVIEAEKLATLVEPLKALQADLFIVASFGKIMPNTVIGIPPHKTLNVHPSLLPKYRGPSPLPTAILDDCKETGVSIMRMDEQMDHGPVVAQKKVTITEWPIYEDFEEMMAKEGANLLADILPDWMAGKITEKEQNHTEASYTRKYMKADGRVNPLGDAYTNFRKIQAFHEWPQAYFYIAHNGKEMRVKITEASFKNGELIMERVIPEGGKEMSYKDFLRGYKGRGQS
jgi:methionyl-tRNA formyltransferase